MSEPDRMIDLDPDWRDTARELAAAERLSVVEALKRRIEINGEAAALRGELRRFSRLLAERVERKSGGDWLTTDECARLLGLSKRALYRRLQREEEAGDGPGAPRGPLAQAVTRVGSTLRFDRNALEASLRGLPSGLRFTARSRPIPVRASSPVSKKGNER